MDERKNYIRDGRAPIPVKELTSRTMSAIKDRNTKPELILRKALWHNGLKGYRLHWKKVPGKPDISFPGRKIAIFVNGCFWHRCSHCKPRLPKSHSKFWREKFERNVERDKIKIDLLKNQKWRSMVIWECEIKKDLTRLVYEIKNLMHE